MDRAKHILLNLPLIAVAATWAPLAQLVLLAEYSDERGPATATYSIVLPGTVEQPTRTAEAKEADSKQIQPRHVKLLKPVTEHFDTASVTQFGVATVAEPVAQFDFSAAHAVVCLTVQTFHGSDASPPQSARAPPVL